MPGRYLLDTNVLIALFREEPTALAKLRDARRVLIPCTAIGELFFGAYKSTRTAENIGRVEKFITGRHVLPCDLTTARIYGQIKSEQHAKGRPIPDNDLWIAALARQCNLTLASRDVHFRDVDQIDVEEW